MDRLGAGLDAALRAAANKTCNIGGESCHSAPACGDSCKASSLIEELESALQISHDHKRKVSFAQLPPKKRSSYNLTQQQTRGKEALDFRDMYMAKTGKSWGWLQAFVRECHEGDSMNAAEKRQMFNEIRCAVRSCKSDVEKSATQNGIRGMRRKCWISSVAPAALKRMRGAGRPPLGEAVAEELWTWFVDRLANVSARISSALLQQQAHLIKADAMECWRKQVECGETCPQQEPKFPKIDHGFVFRWRRAYGVSWRTVNLRYKVSHAKRKHRIRVFWCNCLRIRMLHEILHGAGKLRFIGFDQKPLYFNSAHACKTLAQAGAKHVNVKENIAASRERFTVMTTCPSWYEHSTSGESCSVIEGNVAFPKIAVLFRIQSLDGARLRTSLQADENLCKLQCAQKGSYRLEHVLQFLEWIMKPVETSAETIVVVLDWYAPHLDPKVDATLHALGHSVLRIGGGITGDIQVGDTHRHGPYTARYRDIEIKEAMRELELRPGAVPCSSRQTVLDRASEAWKDLFTSRSAQTVAPAAAPLEKSVVKSAEEPQDDVEQETQLLSSNELEWKQNGILNAMDGSEDHLIRSDLKDMWKGLHMPMLREQIKLEVKEAVRDGHVSTWDDYQCILESYDDHPGLIEGMEGAAVERIEEDDILEVETDEEDVVAEAEEPAEILEEEQNLLDELVPNASTDMAVELTESGANCSEQDKQEVVKQAKEQSGASCSKQDTEMKTTSAPQNLNTLADAAALLKTLGETALAHRIENCMTSQQAKSKIQKDPTRMYLRQKGLEREELLQQKRDAKRQEDRRLQEMNLRLKLAKAEHEKHKLMASSEKMKTKETILQLEAEKNTRAEELRQMKEREQLLKTQFAVWFLRKSETYWKGAVAGAAAKTDAVAGAAAKKEAVDEITPGLRKLLKKPTPCPEPWPASTKSMETGYIRLSMPDTMFSKKKPKDNKVVAVASEALAFKLFGGKHPAAATTAEAVWSRLDKLLENSMYGYRQLFKGHFTGKELLEKHKHVVDNCVFEACWRYSKLVGPKLFPIGLRDWPLSQEEWTEFEAYCLKQWTTTGAATKAVEKSASSGSAEKSASSGSAEKSASSGSAEKGKKGGGVSCHKKSSPKTKAPVKAVPGSLHDKWADVP